MLFFETVEEYLEPLTETVLMALDFLAFFVPKKLASNFVSTFYKKLKNCSEAEAEGIKVLLSFPLTAFDAKTTRLMTLQAAILDALEEEDQNT